MAKSLPKVMKAVGLTKYLPVSDARSLVDLEVNLPNLLKSDVLVKVKAISVNPIDAAIRSSKLNEEEPTPRILGWDGAGVVVSKGETSKLFNVGDEVIFTGDLRRGGANAEYVALDEDLVGTKPKNLTFEQAAAMPLTALTAYEALYDRLELSEKDKGKSILIINSAGGVGSVATQLAKNLGLTVIGTASRKETTAFTRQHGAEYVLNHRQDLVEQLKFEGFANGVDYILVIFDPTVYWGTLMNVIKPEGKICTMVNPSGPVDIRPLKDKSITLASESMLTRILFQTKNKSRHHVILEEVSKMLESGKIKCTLTKTLSPINAENLREAHRLMEEKSTIGKLVLSGF